MTDVATEDYAVATEDYWLRFSLIGFRGELPLLNFNRQAPLCMVCGDEFNPLSKRP
jgi:hypothetical protein